jgi:hypothetical protein
MAVARETMMIRTKKQDVTGGLPEPMAISPDELVAVATATAGGVSLALSSIIRAGGFPPYILNSAAMTSVTTLAV